MPNKATTYLTPDIHMALTCYQMVNNLPSPGNAVAAILTEYFASDDDSTAADRALAAKIDELTQQFAVARARVDRLERSKPDIFDDPNAELSATIDRLAQEFAAFRKRLAQLENAGQ